MYFERNMTRRGIAFVLILFMVAVLIPVKANAESTFASETEIAEWIDTLNWTREYLPEFSDSMALKTMHYLIDYQGLSKSGAAGIVGNIYTECRFDPTANCGGTHIGIMQWDWLERWPKITKWIESNGMDVNDYYSQLLAAFYSEDMDNYQEVLASMRSMEDSVQAADYWQILYEGAEGQGTGQRELGARLALALYPLQNCNFDD